MSKKNLNIRNRNKYAFSKKMKPIRNRYLKQDNATNNKKKYAISKKLQPNRKNMCFVRKYNHEEINMRLVRKYER